MAQGGKKVLFTSHTANFSKFNRPFMRLLKEQGYEVHYASAGEEKVEDCDKHFTVPFSRSPFATSNVRAYQRLKKVIDTEKYELIHTHTPMGSVVTRLAARATRAKNNTRVIYTAHGFHFFKGAPALNWLIYYPIEKWLARSIDTLITINKEDYELAKRKFATNVHYVPGVGIDPNKFNIKMTKPQKLKLRKSLGLKQDDFVMIYLAELSKRKNQLWLINALTSLMKENPKFHLLLAGQDSLNGKCQQLVKDLGLEDNIHFLGYRKDIAQLLKISDLAVSSSLQEGLPVNIMEAMCAGLPVVVTDCRGNRDLLQYDDRLVVRKNDADGLQREIVEIYNSRILQKELVRSGVRTIEAYFLPVIMKKMSSLYRTRTLK